MNSIEQLEASGSHRAIGRNIGYHFASAIHRFFDNYSFISNLTDRSNILPSQVASDWTAA